MQLLSVNISQPKTITHNSREVSTGIFKQPVTGPVFVGHLNIEGDGQADLKNHGGEQRAVYAYPIESYRHWERELGRDEFAFGQFGENLTVSDMPDTRICIGDRFRIGGTLLEVTQPRLPCYKMAISIEVEGFEKRMLKSGHLGFYLRVLEEGELAAGDAIECVFEEPHRVSISDLIHLLYVDRRNQELASKAASIAALPEEWAGKCRKLL